MILFFEVVKMKKNMNVDYEFCKNAKLTVQDLFSWIELEFEYGISDFNDRYLRSIGHDGEILQVSEVKKDFDRWANSVDFEFDLSRKKERKAFIEFIESERLKMLESDPA